MDDFDNKMEDFSNGAVQGAAWGVVTSVLLICGYYIVTFVKWIIT